MEEWIWWNPQYHQPADLHIKTPQLSELGGCCSVFERAAITSADNWPHSAFRLGAPESYILGGGGGDSCWNQLHQLLVYKLGPSPPFLASLLCAGLKRSTMGHGILSSVQVDRNECTQDYSGRKTTYYRR